SENSRVRRGTRGDDATYRRRSGGDGGGVVGPARDRCNGSGGQKVPGSNPGSPTSTGQVRVTNRHSGGLLHGPRRGRSPGPVGGHQPGGRFEDQPRGGGVVVACDPRPLDLKSASTATVTVGPGNDRRHRMGATFPDAMSDVMSESFSFVSGDD